MRMRFLVIVMTDKMVKVYRDVVVYSRLVYCRTDSDGWGGRYDL